MLKIWSFLPNFLKADREQASKIPSVENQTKGYFAFIKKKIKLEDVSSAKHSKYFFLSCIQLTRHMPTCHFNSGKLCSKHMRSRLCKVFILSNNNRKLPSWNSGKSAIQDRGSKLLMTANTTGLHIRLSMYSSYGCLRAKIKEHMASEACNLTTWQ